MSFQSSLIPPAGTPEKSYWFCFQKNRMLLLDNDGKSRVPMAERIDELQLAPLRTQFLVTLNGIGCNSVELPLDTALPSNAKLLNFFELFNQVSEPVYRVAIYAQQIVAWDRNHQFCGRCGERTDLHQEERAKKCPSCGLVVYPRITPAMMVAILKEDKILLAKNKNFPGGFYSVLAGFVEPGERLEDCIDREVNEEVGLTIKNLRYFNSQPWPFPDSLMIAFVADYASGEIQVDGKEIVAADWYKADELPKCPSGTLSIAGRLIDWFKKEYAPR